MKYVCAVVLILSFNSAVFAQVSDFVKQEMPEAVATTCPKNVVVSPVLLKEKINGDVSAEDLSNVSAAIAAAFTAKISNAVIIPPERVDSIMKCSSKVVVIKLKTYTTEPPVKGKQSGHLAITAYFFKLPIDKEPYLMKEFSAIGESNAGDIVTLKNAVAELNKTVKVDVGSW